MVSQFWSLGNQTQGVCRVGFFWGCGGKDSTRPLSSVCLWSSPPYISPNCPSFTHVCFCVPISSFYKDIRGFPDGASGKEFACQCRRHRDMSLTPGSGRSPGRGHGNPFQYSCLENPHGQRSLVAAVCRIAKSLKRIQRLRTYASIFSHWKESSLLGELAVSRYRATIIQDKCRASFIRS